MFDMSDSQKQAFSNATGGVSALSFNHFILFLIGLLATLWLVFIFSGTLGSKNMRMGILERANLFFFAVAIYTAVGVVIHFT